MVFDTNKRLTIKVKDLYITHGPEQAGDIADKIVENWD